MMLKFSNKYAGKLKAKFISEHSVVTRRVFDSFTDEWDLVLFREQEHDADCQPGVFELDILFQKLRGCWGLFLWI